MANEINSVRYSDPRAVQVRIPGTTGGANDMVPHSAVHGDLNVLTETQLQAKTVIDGWPEIMRAAAVVADKLIANATAGGEDGTEKPAGT